MPRPSASANSIRSAAASLAREEQHASELGCEDGEILVRLVAREHAERLLHPRNRLVDTAAEVHHRSEPGPDARRGMPCTLRLEEGDRFLEERLGLLEAGPLA